MEYKLPRVPDICYYSHVKTYAELKRKTCTKCLLDLPVENYRPRADRPGMYYSVCRQCDNKKKNAWMKNNPEKAKQANFRHDLSRHYGLSLEQYNQMYAKCEGRCECCGAHESEFKRGLHIDHDKETGLIRGILCTRCNPGLGYFQHSSERLQMAIKYLDKFKK